MANPQKENGNTQIANEILEVLAKTELNGGEFRFLIVLWRKTYGWNKKEDWISLSQMEKLTGFSRWYVSKTKQLLVSKRLLLINGQKMAFNKDYSQWVSNSLLVSNSCATSKQQNNLGSKQGVAIQKKLLQKKLTKESMLSKRKITTKKTIQNLQETGDVKLAVDYRADGFSPEVRLKIKKTLERSLGLNKTNKWCSFIYGTGWDFLTAYEQFFGCKWVGNIILDEVAKNLLQYYENGETRETMRDMLGAVFYSSKTADIGITPNIAFSTHTYNLWKQGNLKPPKETKKIWQT